MTTFADRAIGAFLGLALGDAYGRPLEFIRGHGVRSAPAGPGHDFRWTDDTHMALYLGQAALEHGPGPLNADRFGSLVGEQFSAWLDDPLTPTTAPGSTCMAGARAWRRCRDWNSSGDRGSDGCGAVMRICPLPILYRGEDLRAAARVSALITHAHPNAPEAAMAVCWMTRALLEGRPLDEALVREAMAKVEGVWDGGGGSTVGALASALAFAERDDGEWLDEKSIPDGDGGWRAPSALGLAVASALRWGVDSTGRVDAASFALAVEKSARIDGDSDSVACLTGMMLGAIGGSGVLPTVWLEALPERRRIEEMAKNLAEAGRADAAPRHRHATENVKSHSGEVWVALADLHGHPGHLDALLSRLDAELGNEWILVTLGDYVDNGPDIPGLMDRLIALRDERGGRFVPLLGNHDLACLRALGWPGVVPDPAWYERWSKRYWGWRGGRGSTGAAYGANSAAELAEKMPSAHQAFLRSLPWFFDNGEYIFVHSGMEAGALTPQRIRLAHKQLPKEHTWLPPQIREKRLAGVSDPGWERVVVSGHTRRPSERAGDSQHAPHFITEKRLSLSGELDQTGVLYAVELPSRRIWSVLDAGAGAREVDDGLVVEVAELEGSLSR